LHNNVQLILRQRVRCTFSIAKKIAHSARSSVTISHDRINVSPGQHFVT